MSQLLTLLDLERAQAFYRDGHWQQDTLYKRLRHWAKTHPDRPALSDMQARLSWGELLRCVDSVAADLVAAGLREGDRVSIWLPNRIETAVLMLACSRMGFICNTSLHRDYTCAEVIALLQRAGSAAFFYQEGFGADADRHDIHGMLGVLPALKKVVVLRRSGEPPAEHSFGLGFPITQSARTDQAWRETPDRVVYLAFTSGTTGHPKGVMHSDNTLLANARAICADFSFDAETVVYAMSPLSHNMGIVGLVVTLVCGGHFVAHTPLDPQKTIDRIIETGGSYLVGVPTHAIDLVAEAHRRGLQKLGRVSAFQLGGSPIPSQTVSALITLGVTLQNAFGMTENCSFQYTRATDDVETIVETCGRACSGMEMSIWDSENQDIQLGVGQIGEMACRGASLMLGYFGDQHSTERSFNREGWFMTGDLGSLDEVGNLRIAGRKKDLIIRGGHNIYPARIEDLAMRHANVLKAAAFAMADERLGEKVCLAIIAKTPGAHGPDDLLAHLASQGLSKYDMPEYYIELDRFPLTASGKVLKRTLVDMARNGDIQPKPIRWVPRT